MNNPAAPIGFAVVFAVVAVLGTYYLQASPMYMAVGAVVAAAGGALCGYLLSSKKSPQGKE